MNNKKATYRYTLFILLMIIEGSLNFQGSAQILRYTDHEPLGGMRTQFINDVFFSEIEKESNVRLKIEAHWGSEINTGYDALRLVKEGVVADMAIVVPEYAPKELLLHQIFKSFPVGPTGDKQVEFFRRVYAEIPAFPAELEKENVVNIFFGTGYPVAFFSTKPLGNLKDIKGGKWRSASFWHKDFLQNAGATPVTMPWNEGIFTALENGTLDGLMVNIDGGDQLKVDRVAPNILFSDKLWMGHIYLLVMNKDIWNSLAKEDQEAIGRAAEKAYKTLGSVMNSSFAAQVEDMRNNGAKIRVLEPEELERWKTDTQFQKVQDTWVKEQGEKGIKDVGTVMNEVRVIMSDVMRN